MGIKPSAIAGKYKPTARAHAHFSSKGVQRSVSKRLLQAFEL